MKFVKDLEMNTGTEILPPKSDGKGPWNYQKFNAFCGYMRVKIAEKDKLKAAEFHGGWKSAWT